uniref:Uncharacterized protein n=1 Tax=Chondria sp. (in: red algae) TaxID=1982705 RepID=A0A1Z1MDW4_9FLOR|nr:hypothetical protein [Chondria sp. (in: red algae)]
MNNNLYGYHFISTLFIYSSFYKLIIYYYYSHKNLQ